MKSKVFIYAAILSSMIAMPEVSSAQGPGWVHNLRVTKIINTSNGGVNVRVSPDLSGCVSQSGYGAVYGSVYPSHTGINRIKADLMLAYVTGDVISLYLDDSNCTITETVLGGLN